MISESDLTPGQHIEVIRGAQRGTKGILVAPATELQFPGYWKVKLDVYFWRPEHLFLPSWLALNTADEP